jgi:hypothetical protein
MSRYRHLALAPTRPHIISALHAHFLAVASGGRFAKVVHHPGNKRHPWVGQGIAAARDQAVAKAAAAIFRAVAADEGGD